MDKHLDTLRKGKYLKESEVKKLCERVAEIFAEESNV